MSELRVLRRIIQASASLGVILVSSVALIGYALNWVRLYHWGSFTPPLPINGAICFFMLGVATLLFSLEKR